MLNIIDLTLCYRHFWGPGTYTADIIAIPRLPQAQKERTLKEKNSELISDWNRWNNGPILGWGS